MKNRRKNEFPYIHKKKHTFFEHVIQCVTENKDLTETNEEIIAKLWTYTDLDLEAWYIEKTCNAQ